MPFRLFLFCLFLMGAAPAMAAQQGTAAPLPCTCTPAGLDVRVHDAAAVFTGKVASIKTIEKYVQHAVDDLPVEVTVSVIKGYKGVKDGETFTLHSSLTRNTCTGHPYVEGGEYLFFAYMRRVETFEYWSLYNFPSGTFDVGGLCGGTKALDDPKTAAEITDINRLLAAQPEKKSIFGFGR